MQEMATSAALNLSSSLFSNDTSEEEEPPLFEYQLWQKIFFSCFIFPIIFFSISGNILVIVAIAKFCYLRITNNIFLASLAVADCAVGILAMPPNAIQLLTGRWYGTAFLCRFWHVCDVLFSTASILHLCCVSIDRYLSISDKFAFTYQVEHPTKSWRVRIMLISVWVISALVSFVPIFTNWYTTPEQAARMDRLDVESNGQCAFIVNTPYRFLSSAVSFWIPGAAMVTFYTLVMIKAYRIENNEFKKYKHLQYKPSIYSHQGENLLTGNSASGGGNTGELNVNTAVDSNLLSASQVISTSSSNTSKHHQQKSMKSNSSEHIKMWRREYKVI
jgi:hypothetical protein